MTAYDGILLGTGHNALVLQTHLSRCGLKTLALDRAPQPGAGSYRTPIPGLYLCGGSTHPGGNITGLCGSSAARVIAAEAGGKVWWNPPDIEARLAALG